MAALLVHIQSNFPRVNWPRKGWHVLGGLTTMFVCLQYGWPWTFYASVVTLLTWVTIESMRRREPWFGRLFIALSSPLVRHHERRSIIATTWFAVSITILSLLFRDQLLLGAIFVGWTFGDPAAEIFGKTIPSKKYFGGEKSVAGTIGCFLISFVAYIAFFRIFGVGGDIASAALTGAAATTLAESFSLSFSVNDNFTIPLFTALALSYVLI